MAALNPDELALLKGTIDLLKQRLDFLDQRISMVDQKETLTNQAQAQHAQVINAMGQRMLQLENALKPAVPSLAPAKKES